MGRDTSYDAKFDSMGRRELEGYARDFGIPDPGSLSDMELRKRLKSVEGSTGTAPESDLPVERRGDPGRGPNP